MVGGIRGEYIFPMDLQSAPHGAQVQNPTHVGARGDLVCLSAGASRAPLEIVEESILRLTESSKNQVHRKVQRQLKKLYMPFYKIQMVFLTMVLF